MTLGTPANNRAQAAMRDAERRAKRKLNRLRRNGINTGGINPIHSRVDLSDTRAVKKYTKQLESFIDRKTRYISADKFSKGWQANYEGAPIRYSVYREYMQAERAFNKAMQKRYDEMATKPFVQSGRVQGTVENVSVEYKVQREKHAKADISTVKIKNEADLLRRAEILRKAASDDARLAGMERYRQHLLDWSATYNNGLQDLVNSLTAEQLWELRTTTNFDDAYHMYYPSGGEYIGDVSDDLNDAVTDNMRATVRVITARIPGKRVPAGYTQSGEDGTKAATKWREVNKAKAKKSKRGKKGKRRKR